MVFRRYYKIEKKKIYKKHIKIAYLVNKRALSIVIFADISIHAAVMYFTQLTMPDY